MDLLQALIYLIALLVIILSSLLTKKNRDSVPGPEDEEEITFEELPHPKKSEQEKIETENKETRLPIQKAEEVEKQQPSSSTTVQNELSKKLKIIEKSREQTLSEQQTTLATTYELKEKKTKIAFDKEAILNMIIGNIILGKPKFIHIRFGGQKPIHKK